MRRILALAFVLMAAPAVAQVQPSPMFGPQATPLYGVPASAVSGSGSVSASLIPAADNTYDLGSSTFRWKDLWLGGSLDWSDVSLSRGAADVLQLASGDKFAFGGVTSGVPMLKANGATLEVRRGDDANYTDFKSASVESTSFITGQTYRVNNVLAISATAPTVTSAGTSPSIATNGTITGRINVGTGGSATTIVLAMPTAATGWNCHAENLTATAANRANQRMTQQSSTTTAVTLQNQTVSTGAALAFTASDIVSYICFAY